MTGRSRVARAGWAAGAAWLMAGGVCAWAQTPIVYNPSAFFFDHADAAITEVYVLELFRDGDDPAVIAPRWTYDIPAARMTATGDSSADGPTYRFTPEAFPALPVGTSYRARLRARGASGISEPSNVTPRAFRFSPCAIPGASGITPGVMEAPTTWPTLTVGRAALVTLTVTTPAPVQQVTLDLIGDGQPTWTFVVTPAQSSIRAPVEVFWGPFPRAGRYRVEGTALDARGCQAALPFGIYATVTP